MQIPDKLHFTPIAFLDFAEGGYSQTFYNAQYGISVTCTAEKRGAPIKRVITMKALPGREFESAEQLNAYLAKLEAEEGGQNVDQ